MRLAQSQQLIKWEMDTKGFIILVCRLLSMFKIFCGEKLK